MKSNTKLFLNTVCLCLFILISACSENAKQQTTDSKKQTEPTTKVETPQDQTVQNQQASNDGSFYYKANGNEPGWLLQIKETADGMTYELALDYGAIKKTGKAALKRLDKSHYGLLELFDGSETITSKLKMENCTDAAGNTNESSIVLRHNGKSYQGCGNFTKDFDLKNQLKSLNKIDHYICFRDDSKKDRKIWVSFNEAGIAMDLKYEGQTESLALEYEKEEYTEGGAYPTIIKHYNEIYGGKINGSYKITHSGNWDYVEYERGKDKKLYNFTIDHELNPYGKSPCF